MISSLLSKNEALEWEIYYLIKKSLFYWLDPKKVDENIKKIKEAL